MRIVPFLEANNDLECVLDDVVNDADCIVITRPDAEDMVVMPISYFNSLMETMHLIRSPSNATHLKKSIAQYKADQ